MTYYNSDPVPVNYTDEELLVMINDYISKQDSEFSYKNICSYIVNEAKRNNKVEGAPYTRYSSSNISIPDGIRISKVLWEKIWNKEIFIAFGDNPYRGVGKDNTRFCKV